MTMYKLIVRDESGRAYYLGYTWIKANINTPSKVGLARLGLDEYDNTQDPINAWTVLGFVGLQEGDPGYYKDWMKD